MFARDEDTIFAPASGVGRAAIAVLRISGPGCAAALEAIAPGGEFPDRRAVLITLRRPRSGEPLDRALVTRFQSPRSFTGEEMAEVSVTGGRAVNAAVVKTLATIPGLRLAEPGEFAWRAFVNGKIDLAEVEGLADLVEAETEAQRRQAQRIAGGALSRECDALRASLIEAMAAVEAQIMAWHKSNQMSRRLAIVSRTGPIIATAIVATVAEPGEFHSGRSRKPARA